jgi:hypothetical protein
MVELEVPTMAVVKSSIFWYKMPRSLWKVNWPFRGICRLRVHDKRVSHTRNDRAAGRSYQPLLATCLTVVSFLAYSSTLKMEATCSFEISVAFQWITWCYIPEDRTLQGN